MSALEVRDLNLLRHVFLGLALIGVAGSLINAGYGTCVEIIAAVAGFSLLGFILQELRRARRKSLELEGQLVQLKRMNSFDEMSAGIAHEINNPLNIIMQEAEIIRVNIEFSESCLLTDEIDESIGVIRAQVRRCSEVTRKLLDMGRKRLPVTQQVDINKLLKGMLALVDEEVGGKKIKVVRDIPSGALSVNTDPPLLRQVFLNLLKNAIQAVGHRGEIVISSRREGGKVVVRVADNGVGIAEDKLPHIFTPFFTTKSPEEGTGIGLAVSLRIINQLGGTIDVESSVGKGTVFSVAIPVNGARSS
ncbi:sensor histidine kinase [Maridesulfovibrio salexigens]|uniref:histidine kinase n=1 Tax=Maridesulfovibrio salexigens (strain ATCC 14822 / DSM 2638 / NCIMB 8403 / VKM B-1763) TaxID=526222 RepID=C6BUB9_MARSD|nr:ATP-binding protein [Maridesulfovibrio salexigens]ACS79928.1 histidine kinase [Maridesulfovibrio salexigens DSM 2638]